MPIDQTERPESATLLRTRALCKFYRRRCPDAGGDACVRALSGVDLVLQKGAVLALVGESGSGKSTLARCLVRLEAPDSGEIWFDGQEISKLRGFELSRMRPKFQLIFQDPTCALNPRLTAEEIIEEPLLIQRRAGKSTRRRRVQELMEQVGLGQSLCDRRPHELSGGQRQRLAIARALALEPQLLILDEAFAGLDPSLQAQLVMLLRNLQACHFLTCLIISHDFDLVAHLADEVAVLHRGKIVERLPSCRLPANARHWITRMMPDSNSSITEVRMPCGF